MFSDHVAFSTALHTFYLGVQGRLGMLGGSYALFAVREEWAG